MNTTIEISEIPEKLLPYIRTNKDFTVDYNGLEVKEIYKFRDLYRINTSKGQYRTEDATLLLY